MPLSGFGLSMYPKIRELIYRIKTHGPVPNAPVRQLLVLAQRCGLVGLSPRKSRKNLLRMVGFSRISTL